MLCVIYADFHLTDDLGSVISAKGSTVNIIIGGGILRGVGLATLGIIVAIPAEVCFFEHPDRRPDASPTDHKLIATRYCR